MKWSRNHHHPMLLSLVFCIKVEKNLHRWKFLQHTSASRNVLNTEGTVSIVRLVLVRNTSSPGVEIADWCASSGNFLQIQIILWDATPVNCATRKNKCKNAFLYCYFASLWCQLRASCKGHSGAPSGDFLELLGYLYLNIARICLSRSIHLCTSTLPTFSNSRDVSRAIITLLLQSSGKKSSL